MDGEQYVGVASSYGWPEATRLTASASSSGAGFRHKTQAAHVRRLAYHGQFIMHSKKQYGRY